MRVRVLPSALFEHGPVAQMDESACLRNRRSQVRVLPGSLRECRISDCGFWVSGFAVNSRFVIRDSECFVGLAGMTPVL
jgi:hypothetical protein